MVQIPLPKYILREGLVGLSVGCCCCFYSKNCCSLWKKKVENESTWNMGFCIIGCFQVAQMCDSGVIVFCLFCCFCIVLKFVFISYNCCNMFWCFLLLFLSVLLFCWFLWKILLAAAVLWILVFLIEVFVGYSSFVVIIIGVFVGCSCFVISCFFLLKCCWRWQFCCLNYVFVVVSVL